MANNGANAGTFGWAMFWLILLAGNLYWQFMIEPQPDQKAVLLGSAIFGGATAFCFYKVFRS